MRKIFRKNRQLAACVLAVVMAFAGLPAERLFSATSAQAATVEEDDAISLKYVSSVTADTAGSVLRIYGDSSVTYSIPISVTASCTLILDNIKNSADLTVTSGRQVRLILRGTNRLGNICAVGGSATTVRIEGESGSGTLTADNIACSMGGTSETGAVVVIDGCTVMCQNLGCGSDGADASYYNGSATQTNPTPGSNASPKVTVSDANLSVSGNVACGGDGAFSMGTWSASSSDAGCSGEVAISGSYVTIGGNLAVGGTGGKGQMNTSYYNCVAGETQSSSPVTITAGSKVTVTGNVASQPDLPSISNGGRQAGLDGVTVTVRDSSLTAADIASGGAGHTQVNYSVYSGNGSSYNIYGTAGGSGGTLIAENAEITCETAVCGADAGVYQNYSVSSLGTKSGDVDSENHPLDGDGGVICETDSILTISEKAGDKGSRWDGYANPSVYSDSSFIGGTLCGTVYGDVITSDVTAILSGDFVAATEIRNSEEATCAKCTFLTAGELADKTVTAAANSLSGSVVLDGSGSLITYLGIGKQTVKLTGAGVYSGTFMVKRTASLNVFQLDPYGIINVAYGGATINSNSYTYTNESYDYDGDYTISGSSSSAVVTVEDGSHTITLSDTSFDELTIEGSSHVTLVLSGDSTIGTINVAEGASLTIEGSGSLRVETLGNENGASGSIEITSGSVEVSHLGGGDGSRDIVISDPSSVDVEESSAPLRDADGNLLYPVSFSFVEAGTYTLRLNESAETVVLDTAQGVITRLLAVGAYAIQIDRTPFSFRGNVTVSGAQTIYLDDLTLYLDVSKGDITIGDTSVSLGTDTIETQADVYIYQSGEANAVYVEKNTASIVLDGVSPDTQIYLPEDFDGLIVDADQAPIQVVTIYTGLANEPLTLEFDDSAYAMTTNGEGNFSIIAARGYHAVGILIGGAYYKSRDKISVSSAEHTISLDDLMLVWDISGGSLTITDDGFLADGVSGSFVGEYLITQSDGCSGLVTIKKSDTNVVLSDEVSEFVQIKVPEDFTGSILRDETPLYPLVITTDCADCDLQVTLDGETATVRTDENGCLYLVAEAGAHSAVIETENACYLFHVVVDEAGAAISYEDLIPLTVPLPDTEDSVTVSVGDLSVEVQLDEMGTRTIYVEEDVTEILVTDGDETYRYPVIDGALGEPEQVQPEEDGADDAGQTDGSENAADGEQTADTENTAADGTSSGSSDAESGSSGSASGAASGSSGASGSSSSGAGGSSSGNSSSGSSSAGSAASSASGDVSEELTSGIAANDGATDTNDEEAQEEDGSGKPALCITSTLDGVELVGIRKANSYQNYSKKKVRLTIGREENTAYYYKIVKKGQRPSAVEWQELTSDQITVKAADCGQRVYIKAVNDAGKTVKKTTGFVVDTKKPTVKGVKNAAIYKGAVTVSISDNCSVSTVKLNGKKKSETFTVRKKGVYVLTVTDCAGNKRSILFAVR